MNLDRPFAPDELEALPIVAGLVALAITNTFLHAEVTELSVRDSLTGLFNRRYLDATVARMEAAGSGGSRRTGARAAAIMFDLDHFGAINKRHGHQTGDAILRAFADILRARFREHDVVARYGGEEFLAILDGATSRAGGRRRRGDPGGLRARPDRGAGRRSRGRDGLGRMLRRWPPTRSRFGDIVARADVGLGHGETSRPEPGHRRLTRRRMRARTRVRRPSGRVVCSAARHRQEPSTGMTIDRRATAATQLALPLEATPATLPVLPEIAIAPEWKDQQRLWGPALHPMCSYLASFPAALAHAFIGRYCRRGDVVLDPF